MMSCTYTDPVMRPISVARALTCPDHTSVWVEGTVVHTADDGQYLCDAVGAAGIRPCAGAGVELTGTSPTGSTTVRGVISNGVLTVRDLMTG